MTPEEAKAHFINTLVDCLWERQHLNQATIEILSRFEAMEKRIAELEGHLAASGLCIHCGDYASTVYGCRCSLPGGT